MTIRIGLSFIVIGVVLLVLGVFQVRNEDLMHIGGVGSIVFGAVAICIATEAKNGNGQPPRPSTNS